MPRNPHVWAEPSPGVRASELGEASAAPLTLLDAAEERDGVAVFSCNLRNFKPDVEALAEAGVAIEDITPQTIPHDFERNAKIHCCYLVRKA